MVDHEILKEVQEEERGEGRSEKKERGKCGQRRTVYRINMLIFPPIVKLSHAFQSSSEALSA